MAVTVVGVAALLSSPVSWSHHWVWAIPSWARSSSRPGTGSRRAGRWLLFGLVTAIVVTGPMQFMPKKELRNSTHTLPQQFVANIYALLAAAYLAWATVRSVRAPVTPRTVNASPGATT